MRVNHVILMSLLWLSGIVYGQQAKIDPYHTAEGGYGYAISQVNGVGLWWAEGAYQVMKDMPFPKEHRDSVVLESARNEWESFLMVVHPTEDLQDFQISLSEMKHLNGKTKLQADTRLRSVEYVNVTHPTDDYGFKGEWPDALPLYQQHATMEGGRNHAFWISVKVPSQAQPGRYMGKLSMKAKGWKQIVPVTLTVWDFVLPDTPTMRSSFGFGFQRVKQYNNITSEEDSKLAYEKCMRAFSEYKIAPTYPFDISPIKETISGIAWSGGTFDSGETHAGRYAYKVEDVSMNSNVEALLRDLQPVEGGKSYVLAGWTKSNVEEQPFTVGVECYDHERNLIWFENRYEAFSATNDWQSFSLSLDKLTPETAYVMIRLFPTRRTSTGEGRGTVWFDDLTLVADGDAEKRNLLLCGDFETDPDAIDISLDFSDFNHTADQIFHKNHFNSFSLRLKGLGGGTYYSSYLGKFEGFVQGSPEYESLMSRYLKQVGENLKKNNLLDQAYVYWFDEPSDKDYPFVRETNERLKRHMPGIHTFITENTTGNDISDVTDISCTVWHRLNHEKIARMREQGLECWSYLCTEPKSPYLTEFIDHDAINLRMWSWGSYAHHLNGILIWTTTQWNSTEASPVNCLQNPWNEAMTWFTGYGTILGQQMPWGNGDGLLFYPENREVGKDNRTFMGEIIVPSLRLELMRDGIEDYEYFCILEKLINGLSEQQREKYVSLLQIPKDIYTDEITYTRDPKRLLEYRRRLAKAIVSLQTK